jgi:tetratricopeptide (TPR) repeat protein
LNAGLLTPAVTRRDHDARRAKRDYVAFYRMLLAADPRAASAWLNLGQALMARGCFDEALAAIDAAIAVDKSNFLALFTRGTICKSLLLFQDAVAAFLEADRLRPRSAPLLLNLGNAYAELGNCAAAESSLLKAIDADPKCAEARASLGSVYIRQGRFDLAEAACGEALALSPGLVVAHQNLAAMLARTHPEQARTHRDAAYSRQQIFIEPAPHPRWRVLVLCAADAANVPLRGLLPRASCTLINWFIEYAPPGQEAEIPPHDFAFNAIGEPEFAIASAGRMQRFIAQYQRPLLNNFEHVARTARGEMPKLLGDIEGVVVPAVLRVTWRRRRATHRHLG